MKKWISLLVLSIILLGINTGVVAGQSYHFQVPTATVNYTINSDGTATIEYTYNFVNDSGAPSIEYVDIGMPANSTYSYSDMSGQIDGHSISHIAKSTEVTNGVEFGLGSNSIPPGGSGTFHALITNVRGVLYPGTAKESEPYASTQFETNFFTSGSVSGNTDMTVTIFLPKGMSTDQPRYYPPKNWPGTEQPTSGYDSQGQIYYTWQASNANLGKGYVFGAGFPASFVPSSSIGTPPSSGINFAGIIAWISANACTCGGIAAFVLFFGWVFYQSSVGARKRKLQYLPPKISIEGHGIKRGLTAVEAGILMQEPMDKILTMILFSTVKKGAATVTKRDPLTIQVTDPLPQDLRAYEVDFLNAFQENNEAKRRSALQDLMIKLVQSVTSKMKGFSLKETVDYYQKIIDRAWQYINEADTPEVKMKNLDEAMDWTMADRDYEERSRRVFTGPVFVPLWWGRFDPSFGGGATAAAGSGGAPVPRSVSAPVAKPGGGGLSMPNLPGSAFAASVVGSIQNFSSNVIGDITNFTSGVTNKTNPPPPPSSGGRSFGGGGGCACACACAGCACACAGGGR
jgi:hypothetical protein